MKRTQIYFSETTHQLLQDMARRHKLTVAQIIRDFVDVGLKKQKKLHSSGKWCIAQLLNLTSPSGPTDLSKNLDNYLYSV